VRGLDVVEAQLVAPDLERLPCATLRLDVVLSHIVVAREIDQRNRDVRVVRAESGLEDLERLGVAPPGRIAIALCPLGARDVDHQVPDHGVVFTLGHAHDVQRRLERTDGRVVLSQASVDRREVDQRGKTARIVRPQRSLQLLQRALEVPPSALVVTAVEREAAEIVCDACRLGVPIGQHPLRQCERPGVCRFCRIEIAQHLVQGPEVDERLDDARMGAAVVALCQRHRLLEHPEGVGVTPRIVQHVAQRREHIAQRDRIVGSGLEQRACPQQLTLGQLEVPHGASERSNRHEHLGRVGLRLAPSHERCFGVPTPARAVVVAPQLDPHHHDQPRRGQSRQAVVSHRIRERVRALEVHGGGLELRPVPGDLPTQQRGFGELGTEHVLGQRLLGLGGTERLGGSIVGPRHKQGSSPPGPPREVLDRRAVLGRHRAGRHRRVRTPRRAGQSLRRLAGALDHLGIRLCEDVDKCFETTALPLEAREPSVEPRRFTVGTGPAHGAILLHPVSDPLLQLLVDDRKAVGRIGELGLDEGVLHLASCVGPDLRHLALARTARPRLIRFSRVGQTREGRDRRREAREREPARTPS